jgi:hypothetical protein
MLSEHPKETKMVNLSYRKGLFCPLPLPTGKYAKTLSSIQPEESSKGEGIIIYFPPQQCFPNYLAFEFQSQCISECIDLEEQSGLEYQVIFLRAPN